MAQKHNSEYTEAPMTTFGTEQGPSKRYRRLRHPSFDADVWTAKNPLLQKGELGVETDTSKVKIGDGVTFWNDLPYMFDDAGANTDLSNLSATGANIANWSSNVTNCITEIPQDINLTLSDGTLTLKAGSKIYAPNGSGNFDVINITTDRTRASTINSQCFETVLLNKSNLTFAQLFEINPSKVCSGTTDALAGESYHLWYDTENNLIKYYGADGTTNSYYATFSLGLVTGDGAKITSIDQVFNGFGYIGSTVFALPGVKGLIPDGRNTDGTLKNTTFALSSVKTYTNTNAVANTTGRIYADGTMLWSAVSDIYNPDTNYNMAGTTIDNACVFAYITSTTGGQITSFNPKTVFHAVDYSNSDYIANCAMPSGRYTDLTLGNDNDPLIAPADGYYMLSKTSGATGERVGFQGRVDSFVYSSDSGQGLAVYIPVRKGDTVSVRFTATGATNRFRFIYANGAK